MDNFFKALSYLGVAVFVPMIMLSLCLTVCKRIAASWVLGDNLFSLRHSESSVLLGRIVADWCLPLLARLCFVVLCVLNQGYFIGSFDDSAPQRFSCTGASPAEACSAASDSALEFSRSVRLDSVAIVAWTLSAWSLWLAAHKQWYIPAAAGGRSAYVWTCVEAGLSTIACLLHTVEGARPAVHIHPIIQLMQAVYITSVSTSALSAVLLVVNGLIVAAAGFIAFASAEAAATQVAFNATLQKYTAPQCMRAAFIQKVSSSWIVRTAKRTLALLGVGSMAREVVFCCVFCVWNLVSFATMRMLVLPLSLATEKALSVQTPQSTDAAAVVLSHVLRWPMLLWLLWRACSMILLIHDALRLFLTKLPIMHASLMWLQPAPEDGTGGRARGFSRRQRAASSAAVDIRMTQKDLGPPPRVSITGLLASSPAWLTYQKFWNAVQATLHIPAEHRPGSVQEEANSVFPAGVQVLLPPAVTHTWKAAVAVLASSSLAEAGARAVRSVRQLPGQWSRRAAANPAANPAHTNAPTLESGPVGSFLQRLRFAAGAGSVAQACLQLSIKSLQLVSGLAERLSGLNFLFTHAAHQTAIHFGVVLGPARLAAGTWAGLDLSHTQLELSAFSRTSLWGILAVPRALWGEHSIASARVLACTPAAPAGQEGDIEFSASAPLGVLPVMVSSANFFSSRLLLDICVNQHFFMGSLAAGELHFGSSIATVVASVSSRLSSLTGGYMAAERRSRSFVGNTAGVFPTLYKWHAQQWLDLHRRSKQAAALDASSLSTAAAAVAGFNLREYNDRWLHAIIVSILQQEGRQGGTEGVPSGAFLGVLGRRKKRGNYFSLQDSRALTLMPQLSTFSTYSGQLLTLLDVAQGLLGVSVPANPSGSNNSAARPSAAHRLRSSSREHGTRESKDAQLQGIHFGAYSDLFWAGTMQAQSQFLTFKPVLPTPMLDAAHGEISVTSHIASTMEPHVVGGNAHAYKETNLATSVAWTIWLWHLVVDSLSTCTRGRKATALAVASPPALEGTSLESLQNLLPAEQRCMLSSSSVATCGVTPFDMLGGPARSLWLPGLHEMYQPWASENSSLSAETGHCDQSTLTEEVDASGVTQRTQWSAAFDIRRAMYCEELLRESVQDQAGQHKTAQRTLRSRSALWNVGMGDAASMHEACAVASEIFGSPPLTVSMKSTASPGIYKAKASLEQGGKQGALQLAGSGAGFTDVSPVRIVGCHWALGAWAAASDVACSGCLRWFLNTDLIMYRLLRMFCFAPADLPQRGQGREPGKLAFEPNAVGCKCGLPVELAVTFTEGDFMLRLPLATQNRSRFGSEAWHGLLPVLGQVALERAARLCEEQRLPLQLPSSLGGVLKFAAGWSAGVPFRLELGKYLAQLEAWRRRALWSAFLQPLLKGNPRLAAMATVVVGAMNRAEARLSHRILQEAGVCVSMEELVPPALVQQASTATPLSQGSDGWPEGPTFLSRGDSIESEASSIHTAYTDVTAATGIGSFPGGTPEPPVGYEYQMQLDGNMQLRDFAGTAADDADQPSTQTESLWQRFLDLLPPQLREPVETATSAVLNFADVIRSSLVWLPTLKRLYDVRMLSEMNVMLDLLLAGTAQVEVGMPADGDTGRGARAAQAVNRLPVAAVAQPTEPMEQQGPQSATGPGPAEVGSAASGWLSWLAGALLLPATAATWCLSHPVTSVLAVELLWRGVLHTLTLISTQRTGQPGTRQRTTEAMPTVLFVPPSPAPVAGIVDAFLQQPNADAQRGMSDGTTGAMYDECARLLCASVPDVVGEQFVVGSCSALQRLLTEADLQEEPLQGIAIGQTAGIVLLCHALYAVAPSSGGAAANVEPGPGSSAAADEQAGSAAAAEPVSDDDEWL